MLPVVQVFRRDAPGEWWPEGADVFQLLWCPNTHWDPPSPQADGSPVVEIRWRQAATLPPEPSQPPPPVRHEDDDYGFTPRPCLLAPVALTDFPYPRELPPSLQDEVHQLVKETGSDDEGGDIITRVAGSKFGGWPTWHLTEPCTMLCRECGAVMELLFTVASDATTGITVGRWGDLRVFSCPADIQHGYEFDVH
ncbi:hypothetical protein ACFZAT_20700 [Streptomyces sp. NPDC008163]|uniref:hypothetical protein n=1 Tax=Streptomyces sp. NPDC008163 TaxID=3364818 RepID=UPI0036E922A7